MNEFPTLRPEKEDETDNPDFETCIDRSLYLARACLEFVQNFYIAFNLTLFQIYIWLCIYKTGNGESTASLKSKLHIAIAVQPP